MDDKSNGITTITNALLRLPLFDGCSREALEDAARRADREVLAVGHEVLPPEHSLFVVLAGAAHARAGVGPLSVLKPGCILNAAGLLTAARIEPAEPVLTTEPCRATADGIEATCISNLCPHTPMKASTPRRPSTASRGRGQLTIMGGPRGTAKRTPLVSGGPPGEGHTDTDRGGAVLAALSLKMLEECLMQHGFLEKFRSNQDELLDRWAVIVRSTLLPGTSNEILFAVAEVAERHCLEPDQLLFKEGDMDEAVFIVDEGEAVVEKKVVSRSGKTVDTATVGRISRGAVIGDVTLLCAKVSRCATVRAVTPLSYVAVPPSGLLKVLRQFPGNTTCIEERIKETVGLLAEALPPKAEVLGSVKLFAKSDLMFLTAISSASERHVFYCGDILKREGMTDGTLYVVEFGACSVECSMKGVVLEAEITVGSCMGERTLLGAENANATVRVATPLAMMLTVQQSVFNCILRRFPWDAQRFESFRALPDGAARNHDASGLKIFQGSSQEFVREISEAMAIRCFMPGQTVIVQGTADAGQMFAIKGGRVSIEVDGRACHKLGIGDVFGELAMVGVVRRRSSTVRAITFCIMLEIPREAFLSSLDRHPRERQRFEAFATQHEVAASSIQWPILRGMPSQLLYMVNLYAERRICVAEDTSLSCEPARSAAVMVMQGALGIMDSDGKRLVGEEIVEGGCFNEQALLGLPSGQYLVPNSTCEVQILTREVWDKVMTEFPEQRAEARTKILLEMAGKAEERLKGHRGDLGVLRNSALFRAVSDEMAKRVRAALEERIYQPGDIITEQNSRDDNMFWLLHGSVLVTQCAETVLPRKAVRVRTAVLPSSCWTWEVHAGQVLSESVAIGIGDKQPYTVEALGVCLVQVFSRRQINSLLQIFPDDRWTFSAIQEEVKFAAPNITLQDRVLRCSFFSQMSREISLRLTEQLEDAFFAPGEEIFVRNDPCEYGSSCMYILLAGQAIVESNMGIVMGRVTPGEALGEAGAFGFGDKRGATVKAWSGGLVHCGRLHGHIVKAAVKDHPEAAEAVRELFRKRASENRAFQENKKQWLEETVGPSLARSPIFAGFSKAIIDEIATASACMATYAADANITEAGQPADSLLLLLEGSVDVKSVSGKVVGKAHEGAMFGDVSLLGLLMLRTATICTRTTCRVLTISTATVESVLAKPSSAASRAAFERTKQARLEQVSRGMPISGMPAIGACKDDVCLRTLALQADRIQLPAGCIWTPVPDTSPTGPHYGFLIRGHATLQNPEEERPIMALPEGCVLYEGLVAKYRAHIRAITAIEAYRLSHIDFELAVRLSPSGCPWYCTFQMLLKESKRHMHARLQSARGALDGTLPKKKDAEIRLWRLDREMSMDYAGRMKHYHEQAHRRRKRQEVLRTNAIVGAGGACLRRTSSASCTNRSEVAALAAVMSRYPESGAFLKPPAPVDSSPLWPDEEVRDVNSRSSGRHRHSSPQLLSPLGVGKSGLKHLFVESPLADGACL